uniref:Neuromedin-K n=1 Tax=Mola mola TaxID=94237 RepID=A0A3Q3XID7_MOLML
MERTSIRCILPSLVTLVILVFFPAGSWCKVDTYSAPTQVKSEGCACSDTVRKLKRFDDIDYDSFVGLMGKRSAPQPNSELSHRTGLLADAGARVL